ncbi:PQQ-dependent sugar dehydrogenase [Methylorubrum extorquens]|uniref:Glucose sorbosone dehydrogenase n=1 Tax=Methylorubrum extorquens (strain CM4 / NCIMB 13688) TaxID=440085 RepID=B7KS17_METC4|nr:PQQ-dependent sugar dehydrogenase [Methylorubrum extorquens]ACK82379.1 glucose sorbosone dehydrogenase [Methylorubrum extorquens CM4]
MIRILVATAAVLTMALHPAVARPPERLSTEKAEIVVEPVACNLDHPWGLAFLPDGRMLVTERGGRLRIVSAGGQVSPPLPGTPPVHTGEGGLLDVAADPNFSENRFIYLTYGEPRESGAATAAGRGRLNSDQTALEDFQVIFRQQPVGSSDAGHFGSRLLFAPDGKLLISTGDRFAPDLAQDLSTDVGKLIRVDPDGSTPPDNPFANHKGARPEIWSYGHRNIQGLAVQPETGALWAGEFGPTGGDEINIIEPGRNYGWPLVSWGQHMDGSAIPRPPARPDLADAAYHWSPSISFSGIAFYSGSSFPSWRGNLFLAGLTSQAVIRLTLVASRVTGEERIPMGERIRQVVQGPDGLLYLLTDEDQGCILRFKPGR